jgi:hypothetical protein
MRESRGNGEDAMTKEPDAIEEVEARLKKIRKEKQGQIRWTVSRHTAELALDAMVGLEAEAARRKRPSSKSRRRKRRKRLL